MRGERPQQPHYQRIWDAYELVGRTEVSDLIELTLEGLRTEERMFPDLHAHKVTAALIAAGFLPTQAGMDASYQRGYADGVERGRRVTPLAHIPIPSPDYTLRTAQGHPPIPEQYRRPEPPPIPDGWRWVSCSMDVNWTVAQRRHLIPVGPNPRRPLRTGNTLCGATGMGDGVWRRDVRKPPCPHCVRVAGKRRSP